ncbi:MAG: L,D-transpeptidase [Acidobacteriota bacterium]|nr:L,D-transpeptidase [Acidobacteriota bacterium]
MERGHGQWQVASASQVTLTVTAPGANHVLILSRPEGVAEGVEEEQLELKRIDTPTNAKSGKFVTALELASDFAGEIWAEAVYADGAKKQSEAVALTATTQNSNPNALPQSAGGSIGTDESARSDKLTGGRIKRASFRAGQPDIRLTVNLPAFMLTLWQNGTEVAVYQVGIGRKSFPVPVGEREATAIIFNPNWIPPDSAWVRRTKGVEPYEKITADDPRNPLGKIKIPLGEGYLIHEAAKPSDIGRLTSHGCIRMMREDLFDLAEKIIAARSLPVMKPQFNQAKKGSERMVVQLDAPLLVDINYDSQVIEGGVLHLYPDVYGRGAFALDSLRAELQSVGVETSNFADSTLQQMLDQVGDDKQYVLSVADIRQGRWSAGQVMPVIELSDQRVAKKASVK